MNRFYQAPDNEYWSINPMMGCYIPITSQLKAERSHQNLEDQATQAKHDWMGLIIIAAMLIVSGLAFLVVTTKIAEAWTLESHKVGAPLDSPIHWDF